MVAGLRCRPHCLRSGDIIINVRRLRWSAACNLSNLMLACHNLPSFRP
jgi:hypothetical protein